MISLGMAAFGAERRFGWRATTALAGILLVVVTMLVARRLFRSTLSRSSPALLLAIDGNAIVMSRVALLDNGDVFALLGFWFVLLDRDRRTPPARAARRRDESAAADRLRARALGRPWVVAAGAAVRPRQRGEVVGALVPRRLRHLPRRRRRLRAPPRRRAVLAHGHRAPAGAGHLPAPRAGRARSSTSRPGRAGSPPTAATTGTGPRDGGDADADVLSWVPLDPAEPVALPGGVLRLPRREHTPHPWQSNPLTWLFLIRPTNMYYERPVARVATILEVGNPLIWWAPRHRLLPVPGRIGCRAWPGGSGVILIGLAAGYLPWLVYLNRTVFQFYSIAFEPFMMLALGRDRARARLATTRSRDAGGAAVVGIFLVFCVLVCVLLPDLDRDAGPGLVQALHFWLPSWI